MKRTTALFTIVIALVTAIPADAEEIAATDQAALNKAKPCQGLCLKPNAKWHILGQSLALPAYFLLQTTWHEGSHAVVGAASGAEVTAFKPYPHMIDGNFVFGATYMRGKLTPTQEGLMLAAPLMTDALIFTASDLALTYAIDSDSPAAPFFLVGGMIAPLVDFLVNVNGQSEFNDSTRWSKMAGIPKWSVMLVGDALAAVAVWRILHHSYNIFFVSDRGRDKKDVVSVDAGPSLAVSPVFMSQGGGLSLTGRF